MPRDDFTLRYEEVLQRQQAAFNRLYQEQQRGARLQWQPERPPHHQTQEPVDPVPGRQNYGQGWDGLNDLPPGFQLAEAPGAYYANAAYISLWDRYTIFEGHPTAGVALYSERIRVLMEWAGASGFILIAAHSFRPTLGGRPRSAAVIQNGWFVVLTAAEGRRHGETFTVPRASRCPSCGNTHPAFTFQCPVSRDYIWCGNCGRHNVTTSTAVQGGIAITCCEHCGGRCNEAGCTTLIMGGWQRCDTHARHDNCTNCGVVLEWGRRDTPPRRTRDERYVCTECERFICAGCRRMDGGTMAYSDHHGCEVCARCIREQMLTATEAFDHEETLIAQIQTMPGRQRIRNCGVEIEGGNGTANGNNLARDFYALQLSEANAMVQHHAGTAYGFVHVEPDSSVDWEAVIGPIDMANAAQVRNLNQVVTAIRTRVRRDELRLDLRCGLHIHVAARAVSLGQAYNLSHLFSYLEDPIFRIGAAKWPLHRAVQGGGRYCTPIPKHARKTEFYNFQGGQNGDRQRNRYYALSFHNYFNTMMRNCHCGAVVAGAWDECTCELGKCTFEFRLFNTTANPRKLYAYLALCQALVAKAIELPEIRNPNIEFPGLEFTGVSFKDIAENDATALKQAWQSRIVYIFSELPLTENERAALRYCVKNSELALGFTERELQELTASPTPQRVIEEVTA